MAERRMFAKTIVGSARFIKMSATARLLYYDLGMAADDEGVVEAFPIMRITGASEDDLKVLVAKGFAQILNEDLVTLILDFSKNNHIRADRFRPGIYHDLLPQLPEAAPQEEATKAGDQSDPGKQSTEQFERARLENIKRLRGY